MQKFTSSFQFFLKPNSENLTIIFPGSRGGIHTPLLGAITEKTAEQGDSVVSINYPYFDRGEDDAKDGKEKNHDPKFEEEIAAIKEVLNFIEFEKYKKFRLFGKSLGGLVSYPFLLSLDEELRSKFELFVLGYIPTYSPGLKKLSNKITIIQGGKDSFGNRVKVLEDIGEVKENVEVFEIEGADHSYKDENGELKYLDEVMKIIFNS